MAFSFDPNIIRTNMPRKAQKRPYHAPEREAAARATRAAILTAAHQLLVERGYARMTMEAVAAAAGVALDTVYAAVGRKPTLVKLLLEAALSGTDEAVPAAERGYVREIRRTAGAAGKLRVYARALG